MRICTILGARPQFIKAAPLSKALRRHGHKEIVVHTGQHYDHVMSDVFFEQMDLPEPTINLGVGSGPHGEQTGRMLMNLEPFLLDRKPDLVLLYGDTNSTLAGALVACKLHLPIAHVEAGLRSFNRSMPEEHNRVVTDHVSDLLFCPTMTAMTNLGREGLGSAAHLVGDTMLDAVREFSALARDRSEILNALQLESASYILATIHRPYNTDDPGVLSGIVGALARMPLPVIFPVHPRTRKLIADAMEQTRENLPVTLRMIDPVGYLDMLQLQANARFIITDSGGMQKEAYFLRVPCCTIRPETEWTETLEQGWNMLCGNRPEQILSACEKRLAWKRPTGQTECFGDGKAAEKIVALLEKPA